MKKVFSLLLSLTMVMALLAGCGGDTTADDTTDDTASNDAAQEETAELSGTVATDGSTSMEEVIGALGEQFMADNSGVSVTYNPTGSGAGIEAVSNGSCDIGLASRALTDDEKAGGLTETIVALDGYRLAIVERPVTAVKDIRIIVPSKTMTEVSHLLPNDDEEPVHICANRRYVVFMTAGYTIMSRLIEGEFLNYHNVIPAGSRTRVTIDTKEFIETIERASLIITERLKNPLRITFTEGKVVVRCQTNLGRVVDEFNAECEGDEVEIGFNNRYLLDALRNARTEKVRMEISGPLSPVKVLPVEGNDFLYLVLPVRFKND